MNKMGKIFCVVWLICEVAGVAIPAQEIFYEIYLGVARGQVACGAAKCGGLRADDCHGNLNSIHGGARLVVEIAVSSEALDREMAADYAAGGVQEYWLVLAKSRSVECYSDPVGGCYQTVRTVESGVVASAVLPEVAVDLERVFSRS